MRLLNVHTLRLREFNGSIPLYAILSHTWEVEEVTFNDMEDLSQASSKKGYSKIMGCCAQAIKDYINWVWIDTCCIDKSSSAELSEAINSMYAWYSRAEVCYTFLADVDPCAIGEEIGESRWFTRGWTLQELLAPVSVEFYGKDWTFLGNKRGLCGII